MQGNVPPKRDHQQALTTFRSVCDELETHVKRTDVVADQLLKLLKTYPPEVLYRFETTLEKLQNVSASLSEQLQFLTDGRPGSKLFLGEHVFSPKTFATWLSRKQGTSGNDETAIEAATKLLQASQREQEANIHRLESAREELLQAADAVRQHVIRSHRLELLPRNNQAGSDLLACIWFAFELGLVKKAQRQQSAIRAKELFSKEHMAVVFGRLLNAYREHLTRLLTPKLKDTKRQFLREAAHKWIETLVQAADKRQLADTPEQVMTAICGLHFAYACHQKLDYGTMPPELQQKYSDLIESVPADKVRIAVARLLEQDTLGDKAFKLLRYVRSVSDAYVAARDTYPPTEFGGG